MGTREAAGLESNQVFGCHALHSACLRLILTTMRQPMNPNRRLLLRSMTAGLAATQLRGLAHAREAATAENLPSFRSAAGWINTPPLDLPELRGKVVLVNFGTYTCINWLRSLPWVKAWASQYAEQGLVTLGVHTPEFGFEGDMAHVQTALSRLRIEFPVAVDSDHAIWRAFANQYWPALYLADTSGRIRHRYFGEGGYEETENMIQRLLGKEQTTLARPETTGISLQADWYHLKSPENYLGHARTGNFVSPRGVQPNRQQTYVLPAALQRNQWALLGQWTMGEESSVLNQGKGRMACRFHARDLHLVMAPASNDKPLPFRVWINGKPPRAQHGLDVDEQGWGMLHAPRLYQLIRQRGAIQDQDFEIEFQAPGAQIYALTFG